jgi:hypothetical protein
VNPNDNPTHRAHDASPPDITAPSVHPTALRDGKLPSLQNPNETSLKRYNSTSE